MRKFWKKYVLLFAVIVLSLSLPAMADEPVPPENESNKTAELMQFDGDLIDLDVTDWAFPDSGISFFSTPAYEQMKESLLEQIQKKEAWVQIENVSDQDYTLEMVEQLYLNTLYDYPEETYFARTGFSYYDLCYAPGATIMIAPVYLEESTYDAEAYAAAVDAAVDACFTEGMTDLEKIVAAHDWIVLNCQYDPYVNNGHDYTTSGGVTYKSDPRVYTSYGVFVEQNAVCQGYALAFQTLMNRARIPCCFVSGVGHAWNAVQLGGAWYYVDTTWDDPVGKRSTGDYYGRVGRDQFLKGETTFAYSHANCGSWFTEYKYSISSSDYVLPDGLRYAADMATYRNDTEFYLISNGHLYSYDVGDNFADGTAVVSSILPDTQAIVAAAMDWESQTLYYSCGYTNASFIYAVGMETGTVKKLYETFDDVKDRGLKLVELDSGVKELWTWYDYTACEKVLAYISVEAGGYSYYEAEGVFWVKPRGNTESVVVLAWYGGKDEFLKADICTEMSSYIVPQDAATLKILAVGDTKAWIPLCAAEKPDL